MAGNQPIVSRDNPLARKLAEIQRINEEYGTRAQGRGAPIVPDVPVPSSAGDTVLPPDPVPVNPEEEARLQAEYDRTWGTAKQRSEGAEITYEPRSIVYPHRAVQSAMPDGFAAIDLVNSQVVATNGTTYPIEASERKELLLLAFKAMRRHLDKEIARVEKSLFGEEEVPPV